jgi:hypothetical protein
MIPVLLFALTFWSRAWTNSAQILANTMGAGHSAGSLPVDRTGKLKRGWK